MKHSNYVKEIPQHVKIKFENVATDVAIHSKPPKSGSEQMEEPKMENRANKRSGSKLEFHFHEMK